MTKTRLPILLGALVLAGCAPETSTDVSRAEGAQLYAAQCAACHGPSGLGDGPAAQGLTTPPADLTRIAARRDGVWPMLEIMSIIDGYTKATNPRPGMPVATALTEGPTIAFDTGNGQVRDVPVRLVAVTQYLESIQSPPPEAYVP